MRFFYVFGHFYPFFTLKLAIFLHISPKSSNFATPYEMQKY